MNYNEQAYLYYNPDIAAAVERGDFESAKDTLIYLGILKIEYTRGRMGIVNLMNKPT